MYVYICRSTFGDIDHVTVPDRTDLPSPNFVSGEKPPNMRYVCNCSRLGRSACTFFFRSSSRSYIHFWPVTHWPRSVETIAPRCAQQCNAMHRNCTEIDCNPLQLIACYVLQCTAYSTILLNCTAINVLQFTVIYWRTFTELQCISSALWWLSSATNLVHRKNWNTLHLSVVQIIVLHPRAAMH